MEVLDHTLVVEGGIDLEVVLDHREQAVRIVSAGVRRKAAAHKEAEENLRMNVSVFVRQWDPRHSTYVLGEDLGEDSSSAEEVRHIHADWAVGKPY